MTTATGMFTNNITATTTLRLRNASQYSMNPEDSRSLLTPLGKPITDHLQILFKPNNLNHLLYNFSSAVFRDSPKFFPVEDNEMLPNLIEKLDLSDINNLDQGQEKVWQLLSQHYSLGRYLLSKTQVNQMA